MSILNILACLAGVDNQVTIIISYANYTTITALDEKYFTNFT